MQNQNNLSDPSAEMAVLSACYNHGLDSYLEIADLIQPTTFTIPYNEMLFVCFKHMFDNMKCQKPDFPTLNSAASALNLLSTITNKACANHITQLIKFPTRKENVGILGGKIRKLQIAREIKSNLEAAAIDVNQIKGDESLLDIIKIAESSVFNLSNLINDDNDAVQFGVDAIDYVQHKIDNPGVAPGLSTGYAVYDEIIGGGLRFGSTNYVGARIKNFKSGFALNVANYNADQKIPVLYLDTELTREEQYPRILANKSGVTKKRIEYGKFGEKDFEKIKVLEAAKKISDKENYPFYHVNISRMEFEQHLGIMRRWVHKTVGVNALGTANPCLIIYDYIKLIDKADMKNMSEHQAIGFIATGLQNFALRYKIPIMVFSQLNRDGMSKESTDIVAQSDRVMWFCTNFSIFKEKNDEELAADSNGNYKLVPIASRHGEKLKFNEYINFQVDGDHFKIIERGLNTANIINADPTANP